MGVQRTGFIYSRALNYVKNIYSESTQSCVYTYWGPKLREPFCYESAQNWIYTFWSLSYAKRFTLRVHGVEFTHTGALSFVKLVY